MGKKERSRNRSIGTLANSMTTASQAAHEVLDNFDQQFPQWKGRGYEIGRLRLVAGRQRPV